MQMEDISALMTPWACDTGMDASWDIPIKSTCTPSGADSLPVSAKSRDSSLMDSIGSAEQQSAPSSTTSNHDCEAQAVSILHSLQHAEVHQGATSCSTDPTRYAHLNLTPDFDRVLAVNKAALHGWSKLMRCSCTQCPHLILLYVSILSKILFWYRIAADNALAPDEDNRIHSTNLSMNSREPPTVDRFSVRPTDIKVGVLSLDAKDQADMRRELLLRELRRVETAIEELMDVDRTTVDSSADDIFRRAVQWSIKGLSHVKAELQDIMQRIVQPI